MTETLCASGSVKLKAGEEASALTSAQYTELINQAEGQFIADTAVNWVDIYATLNSDFKQAIEGAVSAKAAIGVIGYDPLALGPLSVATTKVNILLDEYDRAVSKLKETNIYKAFGGTSFST